MEPGPSRKSVTIYTDGACSNNQCPDDARAGIGVYWENNPSNNVSEPLGSGRQTNQRAEIKAASRGINQAREQGYKEVVVKTDSNYVKNAAESWIPRWDRNDDWSKVTNKTEFQDLRDSMSGIKVKFEKVPSEANAADRLAREGARKAGSICKRFIH